MAFPVAPAFPRYPDWLQAGMRGGAFGKPRAQGPGATLASHRAHRTKLQSKQHVTEALRRAKCNSLKNHKSRIAKQWGLMKFNAGAFEDLVADKRLILEGCEVIYIPNQGPLDKRWVLNSRGSEGCPHLTLTNKFYFLSKKVSY